MAHVRGVEVGAAGGFRNQASDDDVDEKGPEIGHHRFKQSRGRFLGIEGVLQLNDLLKLLAPPTGCGTFRSGKSQLANRTDQFEIAALSLAFGFLLMPLQGAGLQADQSGWQQNESRYKQSEGRQLHADAQHEQDVDTGQHESQQATLKQLLNL